MKRLKQLGTVRHYWNSDVLNAKNCSAVNAHDGSLDGVPGDFLVEVIRLEALVETLRARVGELELTLARVASSVMLG